MVKKDVLLMFYRNLPKSVKFCAVRTFKYQTPTRIYYAPHSYSSIFSLAKLKYHEINSYFPSANFWTCVKLSSSNQEEGKKHPVKLFFVKYNGEEIEVHGEVGKSVMEAATKCEGIMQASCEGQLACTTCHVYVNPKINDLFVATSLEEDDLLDNAPFCKPNSRLSCQLIITKEINEARFGLPAATANMSVDSPSGGKSKDKDDKPEDDDS